MFTIQKHTWLMALLLGIVAAVALIAPAQATHGIDKDVDVALEKLYESSHLAKALRTKAKGTLVFPNILKAGFGFGAHYGKGTLRVNWGKTWLSKAIGSASCA